MSNVEFLSRGESCGSFLLAVRMGLSADTYIIFMNNLHNLSCFLYFCNL